MLALNSGDKLQGDASVAAVIDYTIHGVRNTTIMQLADGQLPIVTGDIYEATGIIAVSSIIIINTDANTRTINLFLLPNGGVARRICPKDLSLQAGYSALIEGGKMQVFDTNGALQTSQTGGDVTGPAVAVDSNMAEFDGITGKIIKDSLLTHADVKDAVDKKHTEAHGTNHTDGTDDVATMSGDAGAGGTKGLVPAQAAGDTLANKFLRADATWAAIPKTSTSATDPTVNDDVNLGYIAGSTWINTTNDTIWICVDNTDGAAVWAEQAATTSTIQKATATIPYNDADGKVTLLTMTANGFIRFVGKVVTTAYDAGTVTVGEEGDEANLMTAELVDAQGATHDTYTPNKYYASGSVIKAFITPGPATEGTFTLILEYVTV